MTGPIFIAATFVAVGMLMGAVGVLLAIRIELADIKDVLRAIRDDGRERDSRAL